MRPLVIPFTAETQGATRAIATLAQAVVTGMGSVSQAAVAAHQSTGSSLGGMALTAAKAVAGLTAAHYIAIASFAALAAAAAVGSKELERFADIAEQARRSNVGTTFFQSFTVGAAQFRLQLKDLEADLSALEKSTRDKFDGDRASGVSNRARDLLQERFRGTNDFGLSNAPALFDAARNAEERIQAILVGLRDMERAGQSLAAIDLARQLGLTNLAERVETGRASFAGFLAEVEKTAATGLRDGSLVSPDLAQRAAELKDRWEANSRELDKNFRPILDECARLAYAIGNGAAWTAEQFTKVVGVIGEAVRLMRALANLVPGGLQGAAAATNEATITALQTRLRDRGLSDLQRRGLEDQLRRAESTRAQREASDVPEMPVSFGWGNGVPAGSPANFSAPVPLSRPPSAGAGSTSRASGKQETDEWATAYERLIHNMEKTNETLKAELATIGLGTVEKEKALALAKAEAEARRTDGELTDEQRAKVLALAEAQARLKDSIKAAEAAQKAYNDAVQFAGTLTSGFLSDIISGGRNAQEAVMNVIKKLADALLMSALLGQGPLAGIFGTTGKNGGVGGLFGTLFGAGGFGGGGFVDGGFLADLAGLPSFTFHTGGEIGSGGTPRRVPASVFDGARRFHRGGALAPGEVPLIGQIGEEMLTRNQRIAAGRVFDFAEAAASGAGGVNVTISPTFDNRGADPAVVARTAQQVEQLKRDLPAIVVQSVREAQETRNL